MAGESGTIGITPGGIEIAAWIFKARPDMWDVEDWLRSIWAWGTVTGEVFDQTGDMDDPRWTDRAAQRQERPFAPVELTVLSEPIPRAELRLDPRFAGCEILRAPRVGNPVVVSPGELEALDEWLDQ